MLGAIPDARLDDQARGHGDLNNNLTESAYDALGRTTSVWTAQPQPLRRAERQLRLPRYSVTADAPSWTTTGTLKADGDTYTTS
ncbi:hypothetical protein ACRAWF_44705 [Streptomyces sp. L7]